MAKEKPIQSLVSATVVADRVAPVSIDAQARVIARFMITLLLSSAGKVRLTALAEGVPNSVLCSQRFGAGD